MSQINNLPNMNFTEFSQFVEQAQPDQYDVWKGRVVKINKQFYSYDALLKTFKSLLEDQSKTNQSKTKSIQDLAGKLKTLDEDKTFGIKIKRFFHYFFIGKDYVDKEKILSLKDLNKAKVSENPEKPDRLSSTRVTHPEPSDDSLNEKGTPDERQEAEAHADQEPTSEGHQDQHPDPVHGEAVQPIEQVLVGVNQPREGSNAADGKEAAKNSEVADVPAVEIREEHKDNTPIVSETGKALSGRVSKDSPWLKRSLLAGAGFVIAALVFRNAPHGLFSSPPQEVSFPPQDVSLPCEPCVVPEHLQTSTSLEKSYCSLVQNSNLAHIAEVFAGAIKQQQEAIATLEGTISEQQNSLKAQQDQIVSQTATIQSMSEEASFHLSMLTNKDSPSAFDRLQILNKLQEWMECSASNSCQRQLDIVVIAHALAEDQSSSSEAIQLVIKAINEYHANGNLGVQFQAFRALFALYKNHPNAISESRFETYFDDGKCRKENLNRIFSLFKDFSRDEETTKQSLLKIISKNMDHYSMSIDKILDSAGVKNVLGFKLDLILDSLKTDNIHSDDVQKRITLLDGVVSSKDSSEIKAKFVQIMQRIPDDFSNVFNNLLEKLESAKDYDTLLKTANHWLNSQEISHKRYQAILKMLVATQRSFKKEHDTTLGQVREQIVAIMKHIPSIITAEETQKGEKIFQSSLDYLEQSQAIDKQLEIAHHFLGQEELSQARFSQIIQMLHKLPVNLSEQQKNSLSMIGKTIVERMKKFPIAKERAGVKKHEEIFKSALNYLQKLNAIDEQLEIAHHCLAQETLPPVRFSKIIQLLDKLPDILSEAQKTSSSKTGKTIVAKMKQFPIANEGEDVKKHEEIFKSALNYLQKSMAIDEQLTIAHYCLNKKELPLVRYENIYSVLDTISANTELKDKQRLRLTRANQKRISKIKDQVILCMTQKEGTEGELLDQDKIRKMLDVVRNNQEEKLSAQRASVEQEYQTLHNQKKEVSSDDDEQLRKLGLEVSTLLDRRTSLHKTIMDLSMARAKAQSSLQDPTLNDLIQIAEHDLQRLVELKAYDALLEIANHGVGPGQRSLQKTILESLNEVADQFSAVQKDSLKTWIIDVLPSIIEPSVSAPVEKYDLLSSIANKAGIVITADQEKWQAVFEQVVSLSSPEDCAPLIVFLKKLTPEDNRSGMEMIANLLMNKRTLAAYSSPLNLVYSPVSIASESDREKHKLGLDVYAYISKKKQSPEFYKRLEKIVITYLDLDIETGWVNRGVNGFKQTAGWVAKAIMPTMIADSIAPYKSASKQHFSSLMKCVFKLIKDSEASDFKVELLDKLTSFNPGLDLDQWVGEYHAAAKPIEEAYKDYVEFIHSYSEGYTSNSSKIQVNINQLLKIIGNEKTSYKTLELMVYIARSNSTVYQWGDLPTVYDWENQSGQELLLQTIIERISQDQQGDSLEKGQLLAILRQSK